MIQSPHRAAPVRSPRGDGGGNFHQRKPRWDASSWRYERSWMTFTETLESFFGVYRLDGDVLDAHVPCDLFDLMNDLIALACVSVSERYLAGKMMFSRRQTPHMNVSHGRNALHGQCRFFEGVIIKSLWSGLQEEASPFFKDSPAAFDHKERDEQRCGNIEVHHGEVSREETARDERTRTDHVVGHAGIGSPRVQAAAGIGFEHH